MSNTQVRFISAAVLILAVTLCVYLGMNYALGFIFVLGIIIIDELEIHFQKGERFNFLYNANILIFAIPFLLLNYIPAPNEVLKLAVYFGLASNFFLLFFLIYYDLKKSFLLNLRKTFPFFSGTMVVILTMSLSYIFHQELWSRKLTILLFLVFGMDTGAWFFGKNFGRHKLWPSVSPNKTIEGLLGGAITAAVLASLFTHLLIGKMSPVFFALFAVLGILSQIGDLIQSKMKRQCGIKDSGTLIPGHGGVYDRLDSLLYLAPFYAILIEMM